MSLELLYYQDKIKLLNPDGQVGILTLWSRPDVILKDLALPPTVAAVANFYGDGISQLLVNLLNNPQITALHLLGTNRAGSLEDLQRFFSDGVEDIEFNGIKQRRIKNTTRLLNAAITGPEMFEGDIPTITAHPDVNSLMRALTEHQDRQPIRQQKTVMLLEPKTETFPSILTGHQVIGTTMLDAWRELLFNIVRFGNLVQLVKGARRELSNVKVVINDLRWGTPKEYADFNLDVDRLKAYTVAMRDPLLPDDTSYTYGNRLGGHFGFDVIQRVVDRLVADREDRKAFFSLWDQRTDMYDDVGHPCWVTGFFRVQGSSLTMTAIFRTHRAFTAWIENVHGLRELMAHVIELVNARTDYKLTLGTLCVLSQSISLEPSHVPLVEGIIKSRKWTMRSDERGEFVISLADSKIVVEHKLCGLPLKKYEHARAEILAHQLAVDCAIGDLSHALYVGRMLERAEICLKTGVEFVET